MLCFAAGARATRRKGAIESGGRVPADRRAASHGKESCASLNVAQWTTVIKWCFVLSLQLLAGQSMWLLRLLPLPISSTRLFFLYRFGFKP